MLQEGAGWASSLRCAAAPSIPEMAAEAGACCSSLTCQLKACPSPVPEGLRSPCWRGQQLQSKGVLCPKLHADTWQGCKMQTVALRCTVLQNATCSPPAGGCLHPTSPALATSCVQPKRCPLAQTALQGGSRRVEMGLTLR